MFTERESHILKIFLDSEYLTMKYISFRLDVSTRTVRRDIHSLKSKLEPFDLFITYEKGKGYSLLNNKEENIQRLNSFLMESSINKLEHRMFLDILKEGLDYYDLEIKYFYSESTIKAKLNQLNSLLKKYHLVIKNEPYLGLKVVGSEKDIRRFLYDNYFIFTNNILTYTSLPNFDEKYLDRLSGIIRELFIDYDLRFTDADFSRLLALILISIYRHEAVEVKAKENGEYNDFIQKIIIALNDELNTEMGLYEISYLVENSIFGDKDNENILENVDKVIQKSIAQINMSHKDYYVFDDKFKSAIKVHIDLMIKRKLKNTSIDNPLLEDIRQKYMMEFNDAHIIADNVREEFDIDVDEDELGFLAIHLGASKNKSYTNKKAVIICNYGVGTSQVVKMKIEKELNGIEVLGVYPTAYLDVAMTQNPDIVISTVKLEEYKYDVPLIEADQFLVNSDSINIDYMKKTGLDTLFNEDLFFEIEVENRDDFFDKSFKLIEENYDIDPFILESIREREKLASTNIGNLVAIPHTINNGDFKSFIGIFKLTSPIAWNNEQVKFVFMIVINKREKSLVDSLRVLYEYVLNPESISEMNEADDVNKFIHLIMKER